MPMNFKHRLHALGVNVGLMVASILLVALVCELVLFRFLFLPTDVPRNLWLNGLVRLQPGDTGVWRIGNEIAARFAVNASGWNSGLGDYRLERRAGVPRVAIAGDSYVEALQVDADSSFAELLAAQTGWEVYRFGIGGGPLSNHLRIVEVEAIRYAPDWVVVLILHNDFDESFMFKAGRYTSAFHKIRVANGEVIGEIPAAPYRSDWRDVVRKSAIFRYFYYRWQIRNLARSNSLLKRFIYDTTAEQARFEANIDTMQVTEHWSTIEAVTDHVIGRLDEVVRGADARLLLVMDGNRQAIYAGEDIAHSTASALNRLVARLAAERGVVFLDLHAAFSADWAAHGQRFEFERDSHWNEHAHAIVAREIAAVLAFAESSGGTSPAAGRAYAGPAWASSRAAPRSEPLNGEAIPAKPLFPR